MPVERKTSQNNFGIDVGTNAPSETSAFNTTTLTYYSGNLLQQDHNKFLASRMPDMPMQQHGHGKNASQETPQAIDTSNNFDSLLNNDIDWESVYLKASQVSQEDCQQNFDGNVLQQDHNKVLSSSMPNVELNPHSVPWCHMPMVRTLEIEKLHLHADDSSESPSGVVTVPLDGGLMQQAGYENIASQEAPEPTDMLDAVYDPSILFEDVDWDSMDFGELMQRAGNEDIASQEAPQPNDMLEDFFDPSIFEEDPPCYDA